MILLCDTCSVLMLIRIAPEMFLDKRFECITIKNVCDEIFRTSKFKTKYPWRIKYKSKLKALGSTIEQDQLVGKRLKAVHNLVEADMVLNEVTGRPFYLSKTDKNIAAIAVALNYGVSTVEHDLTQFLKQQFDKRVIKPLAIVNHWLRKGVITWDDEKQAVLEDWRQCKETRQDRRQIREFTRLTGREYPGP